MKIFEEYNIGKKLNYNYLKSKPFPNIILDDFIDSEVAIKCFSELKEYQGWGTESSSNSYMSDHQVNKFFTPWSPDNLEFLKYYAPTVHTTLQYFNSEPFLQFLSDLTGIDGLFGDPLFFGGGAHKIHKGGKLSLHVDYNIQPQTNDFRVLNLLLYLNPEWKEEWEGALELWNHETKKCEHKIFPIFNRAVIFNLSDHSIHGHPVPLNCPEDIQRYSLALYYFIKNPNQEYYERKAVVWHDL